MNQKMLEYYNKELTYLREAGASFAEHYPKVASRLAMNGIDVADPYVERLLEGFSFLTARIQLKMDAEFPRFIQRLVEVVYPNYLAPTPSMCIVRMTPGDLANNQRNGYTLPRGTRLRSKPILGKTPCEFRTAHSVELLPLKLQSAHFQPLTTDLKLLGHTSNSKPASSLRMEFSLHVPLLHTPKCTDSIPVHICGDYQIASSLYELIVGHHLGVAIRPLDQGNTQPWQKLSAEALAPHGFDQNQALLPYANQSFQGYRLLHEYFAMPSRFHFFALHGIKKALSQFEQCTKFEIAVLLDQDAGEFEKVIDKSHFDLFCTPAINLIHMRSDRIPLSDTRNEFHAVPDRERPMDYEVYSIEHAEGFDRDNTIEEEFRPFYASNADDKGNHGAYFSMRREPRLASEASQRKGPRSTYQGSEVFLSLVNQHDAPYSKTMRQLGVEMTCSNRDLPLLLNTGTEQDLTPVESIPVAGIKIIHAPTRPVAAIDAGEMHWRFVSHLNLSYQSLAHDTPEQGAKALRELLSLYTALGDSATGRHSKSLLKSELRPITRRLPGNGPLVFGRGVAINLEVDETLFAGASPYLLGAVLERYFTRHVGINSFTEFHLLSAQRGEIAHWPARIGGRPTL
ncbi:type VI secretion system baseplate subunit TssF [uncultured Gilvimarinus sp.]|uniref:type VI secretion system baseplate subunit TssF n=1 Tax=uncultured Gilvimarinus sp. TaxID=1689143 RepID=UPI0030DC5429